MREKKGFESIARHFAGGDLEEDGDFFVWIDAEQSAVQSEKQFARAGSNTLVSVYESVSLNLVEGVYCGAGDHVSLLVIVAILGGS